MQQPQKINSLKSYQKNISAIYKQRRILCSELIEKNKSKRLFEQSKYKNTTMPVSMVKLQKKQQSLLSQQQQIKDTTRKLIKMDSFGSVISQAKLQQKDNNKSNTNLQEDKKQKSLSKLPSSVVDRNRRIFGGLNSYLKKAGAHLQSKVQKQKTQNAKEILNKVIEKQKQQALEMQNKKRQQIQNDIKALQERKHENQVSLIKAENQMLNFIVRSHFNAIGNFITTKAEPKVFWLPNKPLPQMQKIKANSDKYLKKKEQQLIEKTNDYKQIFDYGKYLKQNQRQYYENYSQKMYHYHQNYILTKTNPEIFWCPGKMNSTLESLLKESNKILSERANHYKTQNNQFYKNKQKQEFHPEDEQVQHEQSDHQSDHEDQSEEK